MNLVQIMQAGNLLVAFAVPALDLALKIKHMLELDPDISVNITTLSGEAITADAETMAIVADWKKRNNLPA